MKNLKNFEELGSYLFIMFGAILAGFSVACILLPNNAIDYGTAGIAIIISKLTGANLAWCVALTFIPFWVLGVAYIGKSFGLKSLLGSICYTLSLDIFEAVQFELDTEHFLAVVFGGALLGLGLSLILRFGGCIDGSEILANILIKFFSKKLGLNFSMTYILLAFNACVYIAVFLLLDKNSALLSLLVYVVATSIVNNITDHFDSVKQVTIITKNTDNIIREIYEQLDKTCTIIDSSGAVDGSNKTLICYVNYFELATMKEIVQKYNSFSTVSTIDEILK